MFSLGTVPLQRQSTICKSVSKRIVSGWANLHRDFKSNSVTWPVSSIKIYGNFRGQNVATAERGDLTVRTFRGRPRHGGFSRKRDGFVAMETKKLVAPLQCRSGKGKRIKLWHYHFYTSHIIFTFGYDSWWFRFRLFQQHCTLVWVGSILRLILIFFFSNYSKWS